LAFSRVDFISVAFSQAKSSSSTDVRQKNAFIWGAATINLRTAIRHWMGPLTLPKAARQLNEIIAEIQPDLIHAMRVPYEGMLSSTAKKLAGASFPPLLISIWGNDFTLHAPSSPLMRKHTRQTMKLANALHADCHRDIRLAKKWGFDTTLPSIVLPGAGGIDQSVFYPSPLFDLPPKGAESHPTIINPRGFRNYIRNDTFFKAIPLVLKERPDAKFICPTMKGEAQAEDWVKKLGVEKSTTLTLPLSSTQLADAFRRAQILVSPSTHDGTPNSLLEGIACGCYPIAGDLESIREWITPNVNGLLINPADEAELAEAIVRALNDESSRERAFKENQKNIAERAEYNHSMAQAKAFYAKCIA
jgi:glycosyltransferase involved in cell wall biosynthesis